MKKLMLGLTLVLAMGLVANVAFTDETVPFPVWQHGWNLMTFWSVVNAGDSVGNNVTVTINLKEADGNTLQSTTSTVAAGTAWQPSTMESWYTSGDVAGFGTYEVDTVDETCDRDVVYLWGCVFALTSDAQPGYTLVMPGNPYGVPGC